MVSVYILRMMYSKLDVLFGYVKLYMIEINHPTFAIITFPKYL